MTIDDDVMTWWQWFCEHPERGWAEKETTNHIASILDSWGATYRRVTDETGLIADIGEGDRVIALRADLDAIWYGDPETGNAVHACGHSAHMAMVLGALRHLLDSPAGVRVRALFQPAEEIGDGAPRMIEAGAMEGVDTIFGVHLRPGEELTTGLFAPGLQSGASSLLRITMTGQPAHGARIHQGATVVEPLIAIHQLLQSVKLNPNVPYSAKITGVGIGGGSPNVIPGEGWVTVDTRGQTNEAMTTVKKKISDGLPHIAALYGVELDAQWEDGTPAAEIGPRAQEALTAAIVANAGADALRPVIVTPGADDFHFYTLDRPEVAGAMLGVGCSLTPGLHHPGLTYDPTPLPVGARILADAVRNAAR